MCSRRRSVAFVFVERFELESTMDLLAELTRKASGLDSHPRIGGIRAAIRHVNVAEKYLQRGRQDEDPEAFNDVVYRTNQAFEGMLKEAYGVLTTADGSRLSP